MLCGMAEKRRKKSIIEIYFKKPTIAEALKKPALRVSFSFTL